MLCVCVLCVCICCVSVYVVCVSECFSVSVHLFLCVYFYVCPVSVLCYTAESVLKKYM